MVEMARKALPFSKRRPEQPALFLFLRKVKAGRYVSALECAELLRLRTSSHPCPSSRHGPHQHRKLACEFQQVPASGNSFCQCAVWAQTLSLNDNKSVIPVHLDPSYTPVVPRIERIGKAENARQLRNQLPLFHGKIVQPAGLGKSAAMIARNICHGYDFLPRPADDGIQLADPSLRIFVMILIPVESANLMDCRCGHEKLTRVLAVSVQQAKVSQAIMNLHRKTGDTPTVLQVGIQKRGPGLQLLEGRFPGGFAPRQGGTPDLPERALGRHHLSITFYSYPTLGTNSILPSLERSRGCVCVDGRKSPFQNIEIMDFAE